MSELGISKLKAKSQDKRDIILKVHDSGISRDDISVFCIKSNLGGAPTLFHSSKSTNFIFKIDTVGKLKFCFSASKS